ncbi:MAG: hypothetical protein ACPGC9_01180 [Cytophagales bacterium]
MLKHKKTIVKVVMMMCSLLGRNLVASEPSTLIVRTRHRSTLYENHLSSQVQVRVGGNNRTNSSRRVPPKIKIQQQREVTEHFPSPNKMTPGTQQQTEQEMKKEMHLLFSQATPQNLQNQQRVGANSWPTLPDHPFKNFSPTNPRAFSIPDKPRSPKSAPPIILSTQDRLKLKSQVVSETPSEVSLAEEEAPSSLLGGRGMLILGFFGGLFLILLLKWSSHHQPYVVYYVPPPSFKHPRKFSNYGDSRFVDGFRPSVPAF